MGDDADSPRAGTSAIRRRSNATRSGKDKPSSASEASDTGTSGTDMTLPLQTKTAQKHARSNTREVTNSNTLSIFHQ